MDYENKTKTQFEQILIITDNCSLYTSNITHYTYVYIEYPLLRAKLIPLLNPNTSVYPDHSFGNYK